MVHKSVGRPTAKYSQAGRVLELYDRLHRGDTLSAAAVALDLQVDKRTLQRDIATLRDVLRGGLEEVDTPEPGWRLPHSPRRWRTTRWQVMGVSLGAQMMRFLSGRNFIAEVKPLLTELRMSLPHGQQLDIRDLERRLHVIESGHKLYRANPEALGLLEKMIDGLLLRQPVDILYLSTRRKMKGEPARALQVHALCMTIHRGAIYFVVDILRGDWKRDATRILIALDRLTDVRVNQQAQARAYPRDFSPQDYFRSAFGVWRGEASHHVRLRIARQYADAVRERTWHHSQQLDELDDGSLLLTMQLGNLEEVTDWILGMGEHVRAEAPPELIEKLKARLERTLSQYR